MSTLCPGQDTRYWSPDDIFDVECGGCGKPVEFFKDDVSRRCRSCGTLVRNPKISLGCALWCEHAKECLGYDPKAALEGAGDSAETSLLDRIVEAMRQEFGDDQKRIDHALTVLEEAQALLCDEPADRRVVLAAALLHDIGILEAERKHGSSAGPYQELEGPPIARRILEELDLDRDSVDSVCELIGRHHSGGLDSPEFRILWDADHLAALREPGKTDPTEAPAGRLDTGVLKTEAGRRRAARLFEVRR